jgi:hypothetical protein
LYIVADPLDSYQVQFFRSNPIVLLDGDIEIKSEVQEYPAPSGGATCLPPGPSMFVTIVVSLATGLTSGLLANWLYDRLKPKVHDVTIRIRGKNIRLHDVARDPKVFVGTRGVRLLRRSLRAALRVEFLKACQDNYLVSKPKVGRATGLRNPRIGGRGGRSAGEGRG